MQHRVLIITQNEDLRQEIEDSLQGVSLELHSAVRYQEALNKILSMQSKRFILLTTAAHNMTSLKASKARVCPVKILPDHSFMYVTFPSVV